MKQLIISIVILLAASPIALAHEALMTCYTPNVADAGHGFTLMDHGGGVFHGSLSANTFAGPTEVFSHENMRVRTVHRKSGCVAIITLEKDCASSGFAVHFVAEKLAAGVEKKAVLSLLNDGMPLEPELRKFACTFESKFVDLLVKSCGPSHLTVPPNKK
ncbi:MAG: hypothetical protein IT289_01715 [Oligoflexia bacterium]|nr:hypothetical protein [Oligoflexia bacterium]